MHVIQDSSYKELARYNTQTEALVQHRALTRLGFTVYYVVEVR